MIYAKNVAFMKDIHGLKLLRNGAEVWRWLREKNMGLATKGK
jgi:hypothetical protein